MSIPPPIHILVSRPSGKGLRVAFSMLLACGLLAPMGASASEVTSVTIGSPSNMIEWPFDTPVPWQEPVTAATVTMVGVPDGSAMDSKRFLVGRFTWNGNWVSRNVTAVSHTEMSGQDRYALTFDPVVSESVFLVVVSGPTSGLEKPFFFSFGQLTGDTNHDLQVGAADASLILNRLSAGNSSYDARLDVNRDGEINASDASTILNLVGGGKIPQFEPGFPAPPSPLQPAEVELRMDPTQLLAVISLKYLDFGYEYGVETSLDLRSWNNLDAVVSSKDFGETPVERSYDLVEGKSGFFRIRLPASTSFRVDPARDEGDE